jgi:thiol-disulfide isomerase/thioredoxin
MLLGIAAKVVTIFELAKLFGSLIILYYFCSHKSLKTNYMKRTIYGLCLLLAVGTACQKKAGKVEVNENSFREIVAQNPDGQVVKLSDYAGKGKYVLLDFWASWCPPCRAEMPLLVGLYNMYRGKNFEIVGYSLDENAEAWKKGLADLKMTWVQLSHCQGWTSPGAVAYGVQSIPNTFLIDPEGNIIATGLRGDALAAKLAELIK